MCRPPRSRPASAQAQPWQGPSISIPAGAQQQSLAPALQEGIPGSIAPVQPVPFGLPILLPDTQGSAAHLGSPGSRQQPAQHAQETAFQTLRWVLLG